MLPNAASFKPMEVFISGMRLAQLAKHKPWQKKNTDTAMRMCKRGCGDVMAVAVFKLRLNDAKINQNTTGKGFYSVQTTKTFAKKCCVSVPFVFIYAMDGFKEITAALLFL